jgi:hypothetical protein
LRTENARGDYPRVVVHDGWTVGELGFCISYERESFEGKIGFYSALPNHDGSYGTDRTGDPSGHGSDVAYFTVLEPLGSHAKRLRPDQAGISWINRPPKE